MKLHSSAIALGALTLLVAPSAVQASTPARRFASPNADVLKQLCHRVHLLPVNSFHRARALQSCKNLQETVPHQLQSGPTKDKVEYGKVLEGEKAKYITKTQSREPTPQELTSLKALDEAQAKAKKVADDIAAAAATRKSEAAAADQQFMQDQLARQEQVRQQLDDHLKTLLNERNKNAAADAVRQDQLDVDAVADAKAKWTEYEKSLASAKASGAADAKVLESYDAKLKEVQANWERDAAQRKADFAEAENDKKLGDDEAKAARAKAREDRAKEMDMRAKQREQDMATARAERDAALERQRLVNEEAETRAKLKAEQDDAEAALVKNRKNRQDEEAERQKQMDAYAKEEANIKTRREEFEKAEKEREIRAKKRAEDEELRLKAKEEEDLRLAKAREDAAPHEERSKQDDEDDCMDKSVSCGSGKCFQLKSDPKSKRCQCQKGDKGKNCEHAACEYDLEDGAGKKKKQAGNLVNGQCVRWKSEYRCTCDKPWRLDVACVKKEGVKEIEVPKTECKGIREPENEFANQICELCLDQCPIPRNLGENTTAVKDHTNRRLADTECDRVVLTCDGRMALSNSPYKPPAGITTDSDGHKLVKTKRECFESCLERNGIQSPETTSGGARWTMTPKTHCTWVYFEPGAPGRLSTCYFFFAGTFPDHAPSPNKKQRTANGAVVNNPPAGTTGFIAFVVYPRRWELFREAGRFEKLKPKHFCGGLGRVYDVYFGTGTTEGEGTYATTKGRDLERGDCIADQDTVLENAEGYRDKLSDAYKKIVVELPPSWTRYGQRGVRPSAEVVSKKSGITWKYTVDGDFRVTKVTGVSKVLNTDERGEKSFEETYNWVTIRKTMDAKRAPFCAGHLVAYKQKPPNFYFNYVPQNENSNSLGCWYKAELAALNLIQLGCHLEYNVDLDYGSHGVLTPTAIKQALPPWAKDNPSASRPPKVRPPKPLAPGLPPTSLAPIPPPPPSYVNNDLKCHYRFRPFIMNLDFRVVDADPNSHCVNLHHALTTGSARQMLRVDGDRVISTRVFVYLLQKTKKKPGGETDAPDGPSAKSFDRFFGAATTMKKSAGSRRSCYAETGNNADFTSLEMDLAFSSAFLGDKAHEDCIRDTGDTKCRKWSMTPDDSDSGKLFTPDGNCLWFNKADLRVVPPNANSDNCAKFKYVVAGTSFTEAQWRAQFFTTRGRSIEYLVLGTIRLGDTRCVGKNMKIVTINRRATNCLHLRVNYYTSTPKRRRLAETDADRDVDDDEDVNGEDTAGGGEGENDDEDEEEWERVCLA